MLHASTFSFLSIFDNISEPQNLMKWYIQSTNYSMQHRHLVKYILQLATFTITRAEASGPQHILSSFFLLSFFARWDIRKSHNGCPGVLNPRLINHVWAFWGNPCEPTILHPSKIQKNQQEITLKIPLYSFKLILENKLNTKNNKPVSPTKDSGLSQTDFPSIVYTQIVIFTSHIKSSSFNF